MSNSELSAGQRRGVDPLDFSNRDDGRDELKSMLDTIAAQLMDADRRHTAALSEMQERITGMSREADEIRPRVPQEFAPAFAQIETAMGELALRLSSQGDDEESLKQPAKDFSTAEPSKASTPMALHSANRRAADRRERDEGPTRRASPVDTFDVIGSVPGDASDPWDRESAEALAGIYESGAASFSHKSTAGAESGVDQAWLESRFAEIASGIEHSLAAARPDNGLSEISQRLDQFERQFAKLFAGVATHDDLAAVRLIEAHVGDGEVVNHLVQTQDQLERLNIIEAQLATISHTLADVQGMSSDGKDGGARARSNLDVDAIARVAAAETAQRFTELRNDDRHSAADELRPLIERLMSENRQGEEHTAALLDTMQQAMIRLLDRVDSIEFSQQPPPPSSDQAANRSSMLSGETAGYSDLIDEDQAGVLDAAMAAIPPSMSTAEPVSQPRLRDGNPSPEEAVRKSEKIRQDFVAEARRAKMRLTAEHDDIVIGGPSSVSLSSSAAEGPSAGPSLGSRPIRPTAAVSKNTSGPSAPSPRLMIITAVALLALGSLWYTLGFGGGRQNAGEPVAMQPGASAQLPQANGAATSGSSDAVKSAPATSSPSGNVDKTADPSSSVNGPRSDLAPSGDAQAQDAPSDATVRRTTALPMLGVAVDLDQPMTEAELQQAKRHQAMAAMSGELGNAAARSNDAAAIPTSMVPSEAETEGTVSQSNAASGPAGAPKGLPLDMPTASVGPLSLRLAAANGDPSAEFEVGARLAEGKGTPQSFKDAAKWYQRSADQGFAQAQYRLGTLYERGLGLKPDRAQAAAWYQKAAEQGNMKAMHNLAVLSANQSDQSPDYVTAAQWFEEAAKRGLPDSQFNLAVLYENGLGVKRDPSRAFMWLSIAARNGDADAVRRMDILRGKLTADEIAAANKMIAGWRPTPSARDVNDARTAGEIWKNNPKNGING